jgi:hypothetical protein
MRMRSRLVPVLACTLVVLIGACSGSSGGSVKEFCGEIKKFQAEDSGESDKEVVAMFDKLASKSPSEVKGSVKTMRDSLDDVADDPDQEKKLEADKDFRDAEAKVRSYAKDKCNIDLS